MQGINARLKYFAATVIVLIACLANLPLLQTVWIHGFDDGTYSHAFLIPFISAYLFFISVREERVFLRSQPAVMWAVATVIASFLLYASAQAQISLGYWGAWLLMLCCAVPVFFRFSLTIVFPFAYLIFLLPVWGTLSAVLQSLSVLVVSNIMGLTGIPVYVEDVFVQIPSGTFEIADGCSGLRYMIVSLAIANIYVFMFIRSTTNAVKLVLLAILGALITNWLRIAALIVIGHMTEMQSSLMDDHNMFGWYLYIPFMFIFYYVGNKLSANTEELKVNTSLREGKPTPRFYVALAAVVAVIGISGTSLSHALMDNSDIDIIDNTDVQPTVFFASQVDKQSVSIDGNAYQQFNYHFSGKTLDGKPSYYENQMIPDSWQVIQRQVTDKYVQLLVSEQRGRRMAEIRYYFRFAGNIYPRQGELKKARLQYAVTRSAETSIIWLWRECSDRCTAELTAD